MGPTQKVVLAGTALIGLAMIVAAHEFTTPFEQGLLLNLGTAVLLFAALYLLERVVLERKVESVRSDVAAVDRKVETQIGELRREVALAVDDLGDRMKVRLKDEHAADDASVEAFRAGPTAESTFRSWRPVRWWK